MTINCAHRGASGHAPENTLAALELAVSQGADMVEVDVQLTRDGRPVVIHDETVDRTTDGAGAVAEFDLDGLRRLDAGRWFGPRWTGQRVPTLAEVLDLVSRHHLRVNIELKGAAGPQLEAAVLREVERSGGADSCLLTSFDHRRLARLAAAGTAIPLGCIVGAGGWRPELLAGPGQVLSLERTLVDGDLLAAAHAAGRQVHVWTVNEARDMARLIALGADAVITNFPDLMQAVRGTS